MHTRSLLVSQCSALCSALPELITTAKAHFLISSYDYSFISLVSNSAFDINMMAEVQCSIKMHLLLTKCWILCFVVRSLKPWDALAALAKFQSPQLFLSFVFKPFLISTAVLPLWLKRGGTCPWRCRSSCLWQRQWHGRWKCLNTTFSLRFLYQQSDCFFDSSSLLSRISDIWCPGKYCPLNRVVGWFWVTDLRAFYRCDLLVTAHTGRIYA